MYLRFSLLPVLLFLVADVLKRFQSFPTRFHRQQSNGVPIWTFPILSNHSLTPVQSLDIGSENSKNSSTIIINKTNSCISLVQNGHYMFSGRSASKMICDDANTNISRKIWYRWNFPPSQPLQHFYKEKNRT